MWPVSKPTRTLISRLLNLRTDLVSCLSGQRTQLAVRARTHTQACFVVVVTSPSGRCLYGRGRCPEKMRNSTRLSLSWNTSVTSTESPKYRWRSAAQSGQKGSKCSAVSSPVPQWGLLSLYVKASYSIWTLHENNWDCCKNSSHKNTSIFGQKQQQRQRQNCKQLKTATRSLHSFAGENAL